MPALAKLSRRSALAGLGLPFIGRAQAADPVNTFRLAHSAPPDFPMHLRLAEAAARVGPKTNGMAEVKVFPNNQLGSPIGQLAQVMDGSLDAAMLSNETLASSLNSMAVPMIGFAFSGYDKLWSALDGDLGTLLTRQLRDRLGLIRVGPAWDFGFRQISTRDVVIKTAADVVDLRLRTPPERPFVDLMQALRMRPVAFTLGQLPQALRTGAAQGQQGMVALIRESGIYLVQNHCALTNHIWDGYWLLFNRKVWEGTPANIRDVIAESFGQAAVDQRGDIQRSDADNRAFLEKNGMTFNPVDFDSFRSVLRGTQYYAVWKARVPVETWNQLQAFTGSLV
jgi:TRAP-type C4-dicarboxylate transport system substrate-binding protein